jgi:Tfp pilus assembly protein PilW
MHCDRKSAGASAFAMRPANSGFSLAELLIATLIFLTVAGAVFGMLDSTQRTASYQSEVNAVMQNARIAMDTTERILRQAGNNPRNISPFEGITFLSSSSVRVRSDLTGSNASNPDKGDPDGDTLDANEDITIQHNSVNRTLEVLPNGGTAQAVAGCVTTLALSCYDAQGVTTTVGANIRRIRVSITCASDIPHPRTGQVFSTQLVSDVQLAARQ